MSNRCLRFSIAVLLGALGLIRAHAQVQPNIDNGFKPYGSYDGGDVDSVNLQNGNLILHIPMPFTNPQRGGRLAPKTVLTVNSKGWFVAFPGTTTQFWTLGFGPAANVGQIGNGIGLASTLDLSLHRYYEIESGTGGQAIDAFFASGYYLTTWDGGVHQLTSATNAPVDVHGVPMSFDAVDNSGYHIDLSAPDSTTGIPGAAIVRDRQGNTYHISGWATHCGKPQASGVLSTGGFLAFPYDSVGLAGSTLDPRDQFGAVPLDDTKGGTHVPNQDPGLPPGSTSVLSCQQAAKIDSVTDVNGNVIYTSFSATPSDTMGRPPNGLTTVGPTPDFSGCVPPNSALPITGATVSSYQGFGGVSIQIKVCTSSIPYSTAFSQAGVTQAQNAAQNGSVLSRPLVVTVVLSDPIIGPNFTGPRWTFKYDGYLNVTDVGLPTGGSIHYDWQEIANPDCNSGTKVSRAVSARTLNDNNGNLFKWQYTWGVASGGVIANTVNDPLGNDTVHVFTTQDGPTGCMFYETTTQVYQGLSAGNTPLQSVDTTYSKPVIFSPASGGNGGIGNIFPVQIKTTLRQNGVNNVSLVTRTYDAGPGSGSPSLSNIVTEQKTDWGVNGPGPILTQVETAYQWQQPVAGGGVNPYLQANLSGLSARNVVKDSKSCMVAETTYGYDETPAIASGLGTAQNLTPAPNAVRGNNTSISKWVAPISGTACATAPAVTAPVVLPSPVVTSTSTWSDSGTQAQTRDPLQHRTDFTYDPVYVGAYLTKTCDALNHCISGTYDMTTGSLASFTNQNGTAGSGGTAGDAGHTTLYTYDNLNRIKIISYPDGGQTSYSYSLPNVFPATAERLKLLSAGANAVNDDVVTYFDGLGRSVQEIHKSAGNVTVKKTYDGLDHVVQVTNPYINTGDPTYGIIQTQYDALGRVIETTNQDNSVVKVDFSSPTTSNGVCAVQTDEAGKSRRTCNDANGKLIEVDEPGLNFAGAAATGSFSIIGSLGTVTVPGTNATLSTGTVTIKGRQNLKTIAGKTTCIPKLGCTTDPGSTIIDSGTVTITVNGKPYQYAYGVNGVAADVGIVASNLQNTINSTSPDVQVSSINVNLSSAPPTAVINLQSRNAGSAINFSLAASTTYDTGDFVSPSFTPSTSGPAMSGGTDGTAPTTLTDSGTINATITNPAGTTLFSTTPVQYGASSGNNLASQVAAAVATALSASGSPVTAAPSGSSITVKTNATDSSGNSLSVNVIAASNDTAHFPVSSFSSPGTQLANGADPSGPSLNRNFFVTMYTYDGLGNLTCAVQKGADTTAFTGCAAAPAVWRPRSLTYDSLSRVLTANNPESGTITYSYDDDSNLISKTAPAPNQIGATAITATFSYEPLHRLTKKSYSDTTTPTLIYGYDGIAQAGCTPPAPAVLNPIGQRTSMCDGAGSEAWDYDVMGRVRTDVRVTGGIKKTTSYLYNPDGSLDTLTYPSTTVLKYSYDGAGKPVSVTDSNRATTYATGATYVPSGSLSSLSEGANIASKLYYTNRLQLCRISASNTAALPTSCSDLTVGNIIDFNYDFGFGTADNGNVYGIANNRDSTRSQRFTYDPLNRIASAQTASTFSTNPSRCWGESFSYDLWGNVLMIGASGAQYTGCKQEGLNVAVTEKNQIIGSCYDPAGNLVLNTACPTTSFVPTYAYNAENQLTATAGMVYSYDGLGQRVEKSSGKLYWYGMGSHALDETDGSGNTTDEYIYFGGTRLARRHVTAGQPDSISYYFSDHLTTTRVVTDPSGKILDDSDFFPFGGELPDLSASGNSYKFTGKERDQESGLDNFGARYYASALGRFLSPDKGSTGLDNPQSLNRYVYALNNPLRLIDPDGNNPIDPILLDRITHVYRDSFIFRDAATDLLNKSIRGEQLPAGLSPASGAILEKFHNDFKNNQGSGWGTMAQKSMDENLKKSTIRELQITLELEDNSTKLQKWVHLSTTTEADKSGAFRAIDKKASEDAESAEHSDHVVTITSEVLDVFFGELGTIASKGVDVVGYFAKPNFFQDLMTKEAKDIINNASEPLPFSVQPSIVSAPPSNPPE